MSMSNKVKAAAALRGVNNPELATKLNITNQALFNKFNRDSFSGEDLIRIADYLGFNLAFIDDSQRIIFDISDIKEKKASEG